MTRLIWTPELPDMGVEQGVLYPRDAYGEVWDGLVSVQESPSEAGTTTVYRDGLKTQFSRRSSGFAMSVEAFSYPEWILGRHEFGFSYRSGSKIHIVYNARARLKDRAYEQNETAPFELEISAKPLPIPEAQASPHLVIDTAMAYSQTLSEIEDLLYGSDLAVAQLPPPGDIFGIFESNSVLKVTDHGDGTFTVEGPDEAIQMLDPTTFQIDWPSAVYQAADTYSIRSH